MKPRKPDRFERLLDGEKFVMKKEVIKLLRNEHAWIRRMVKSFDNVDYSNMSDDYQAGMHHAYVSVMQKLEQRRK